MAITLETTRPKAEVNNTLNLNLAIGTPVEDDSQNSFFVPINATSLTIPDYTIIGVVVSNESDILTTTGDGFALVEVGDSIAAGTNIATATVIGKTDSNTIQVSASGTADGTENLTFTPQGGGVVDITLVGIKLTLVSNAQGNITIVATGYVYDGTLKGTVGTPDNASQEINLNQFDLDLDSLLEKARIPKQN